MNRPEPTDAPAPDAAGRFFDALSGDYTASIRRCVPRYAEMLWALLDYLPPDWTPAEILELGCGTGNLSELLARRFPDSPLRLVDISAGQLDECRSRLAPGDRLTFQQADFRTLTLPPGSCDLVVSSISLHHLTHDEQRELLGRIHTWLRPGGVLAYSDQLAGATDDLYARHMQHWREQARAQGASDEEWAAWMEHQQQHDHHAPLAAHFAWLRDAGFATIDCPWRYLLWTVLQARKAEA